MFVAPLVIPALTVKAIPFRIGDIVANFGSMGVVVGADAERGLILRAVGGRSRWLADPAKCRAVR